MEGEITEEKNEGCVRVRMERLEERNGFKRRGKEKELEVRKCIIVIYFLEQQTPLGSKCCECCVDFGGASAAEPTEGVAGAWRTEPWGTGAPALKPRRTAGWGSGCSQPEQCHYLSGFNNVCRKPVFPFFHEEVKCMPNNQFWLKVHILEP